MIYFVNSQKLILSGNEESVRKLATKYKEHIVANQREQVKETDKGLETRRHYDEQLGSAKGWLKTMDLSNDAQTCI